MPHKFRTRRNEPPAASYSYQLTGLSTSEGRFLDCNERWRIGCAPASGAVYDGRSGLALPARENYFRGEAVAA